MLARIWSNWNSADRNEFALESSWLVLQEVKHGEFPPGLAVKDPLVWIRSLAQELLSAVGTITWNYHMTQQVLGIYPRVVKT